MVMRTAPLIRRAATLTGAAGLVLAVALPASGAAAPGWRVVKTFGPATGVWSDNFVAVNKTDAWSSWSADSHFGVQHWTGTAWHQVKVPPSLAGTAASSVAIGASSVSNAWLLSPGTSTSSPGTALRWNGSAWQAQQIPSWVVRLSRAGDFNAAAEVFSPSSVWVFSVGFDTSGNPDHFASFYNGHGWAKVALPGSADQVSALSPTDMWALGNTVTGNPAQILMHWDGKSWHTVAIPTVTPPPGGSEYVYGLTATGPSDAWLLRGLQQGSAGAVTLYALHWNGKSWTRVSPGFPTSVISFTTQDGNGGLWMTANGPAPAYTWYLYHLNAGHWTRYTVPAASGLSMLDLTGITWIPGTAAIWSTANLAGPPSGNGIYGAILTYGQ
jgi:hypothetical protein